MIPRTDTAMARPSAVQILTGSATVIAANLALLLAGVSSPPALAGAAVGSLLLGLWVAVRLAGPRPAHPAGRPRQQAPAERPSPGRRARTTERVREPAGP
ncbi:hypothetical protein DUI70_2429 [Streptomyces albus]|nr:hypothetical protein DUI70_2429 [Streptomyces albus]